MNLIVDQIIEEIKNNDNIIILRHVLPDGDAYGFQFGLRRLINLNWPGKNIKITGGENRKISYIGNKFDKIEDQEFTNSLVIVGDTANTARIDEPRWNMGKKIIKFDHHPLIEHYGDIEYIRDDCVSVCEALTELIYEKKLKIDAELARILYHGIVTDSNRFMYRFPKPRTLRLAAFLLEQGFNLQDLYITMYEESEDELKFMGYVFNNYKMTDAGFAYIFLNQKELEKYVLLTNNVGYDFVKIISNIQNSPASGFFCERKDGKVHVELRSNKIKINQIAVKYGGGGHNTSCGTVLESFDEAIKLIKDLDKVIEGA